MTTWKGGPPKLYPARLAPLDVTAETLEGLTAYQESRGLASLAAARRDLLTRGLELEQINAEREEPV